MFFNKSTLITVLAAAIASVNAQQFLFNGTATHFNFSSLPPDFTPCGGNCPPRGPNTLPIALPANLFNGSDVCCSTFTITSRTTGQTVRGTYDFKSASLPANTVSLDNDLFVQLADLNVVSIPVTVSL